MASQADIDLNSKNYASAEIEANKALAAGNTALAHEYHKTMQSIAETNIALAKQVSAANDEWNRQYAASQSSGSGGGGGGTTPPPPPPPAPVLPSFRSMSITNKNFKVAPSDIIQFDDEAVEIALIQDLLFEDIGATELANISRSDLIDGQPTIYSPIKNLSTIRREFNPNNIIATSYTLDYFSRFGIDIISRGINEPYFDANGDLVIEIDTVEDDEEIQVQIVTNGTIDIVEES